MLTKLISKASLISKKLIFEMIKSIILVIGGIFVLDDGVDPIYGIIGKAVLISMILLYFYNR